jgi:hypothetical protein
MWSLDVTWYGGDRATSLVQVPGQPVELPIKHFLTITLDHITNSNTILNEGRLSDLASRSTIDCHNTTGPRKSSIETICGTFYLYPPRFKIPSRRLDKMVDTRFPGTESYSTHPEPFAERMHGSRHIEHSTSGGEIRYARNDLNTYIKRTSCSSQLQQQHSSLQQFTYSLFH